jgi:hypothetical protein
MYGKQTPGEGFLDMLEKIMNPGLDWYERANAQARQATAHLSDEEYRAQVAAWDKEYQDTGTEPQPVRDAAVRERAIVLAELTREARRSLAKEQDAQAAAHQLAYELYEDLRGSRGSLKLMLMLAVFSQHLTDLASAELDRERLTKDIAVDEAAILLADEADQCDENAGWVSGDEWLRRLGTDEALWAHI